MLLLRGMSASGARNRQIRRIAKLLEEGNIAELQQPLIENDASRRAATALHHRAERLRERLLAADDGAFAELAPDAPEAIVARLRALCALARDPGGGNRSRQANRDIYRLLLELSAPGSGT
jgi:ribosome-associated protein